ncbi:MAG: tRNA preQ1(34) S-adenosylmethionine ribosyltransferase-isomerase QueA [Planctomycetes bacterium]|nr:tRNA preQ1(34) S-adenosylmethionine ribosyltransferase-isomerase QueA [Planctomycetota bacterium]
MNSGDFDFRLPSHLIAQAPPERRDAARLMILPPAGPAEHRGFADLPQYLRPDDVLVLNNTRVMPARLIARRATGGRVDVLLVRALDARTWEALLDTPRRLSVGERLTVDNRVRARISGRTPQGKWILDFDTEVGPLLSASGRAPLPPYIRRDARPEDLQRYQTVYAERDGAIAAPTAGLHFTPEMLDVLRQRVEILKVTLHVGVGTFKPVKVENLDEHKMEPEWYEMPPESQTALGRAMQEKRRVVAVGTTTCRTLETWARSGQATGWTDLFIRPPFEFKVVRALLTNFHTPRSTLLMLVSAFIGRERILAAYEEAVRSEYRFFSYGDATLLIR